MRPTGYRGAVAPPARSTGRRFPSNRPELLVPPLGSGVPGSSLDGIEVDGLRSARPSAGHTGQGQQAASNQALQG